MSLLSFSELLAIEENALLSAEDNIDDIREDIDESREDDPLRDDPLDDDPHRSVPDPSHLS